MRGIVTRFDPTKGLGTVTSDDDIEYVFHVVEIADGTRTIDVGRTVAFEPLPRFGRLQAGRLYKL